MRVKETSSARNSTAKRSSSRSRPSSSRSPPKRSQVSPANTSECPVAVASRTYPAPAADQQRGRPSPPITHPAGPGPRRPPPAPARRPNPGRRPPACDIPRIRLARHGIGPAGRRPRGRACSPALRHPCGPTHAGRGRDAPVLRVRWARSLSGYALCALGPRHGGPGCVGKCGRQLPTVRLSPTRQTDPCRPAVTLLLYTGRKEGRAAARAHGPLTSRSPTCPTAPGTPRRT